MIWLINMSYKSLVWAGMWILKILLAPFKAMWLFLKHLGLAFLATPRILAKGPVAFYRKLVVFRNWLLDKVNYLE